MTVKSRQVRRKESPFVDLDYLKEPKHVVFDVSQGDQKHQLISIWIHIYSVKIALINMVGGEALHLHVAFLTPH